jgi:type III restriction enzyme
MVYPPENFDEVGLAAWLCGQIHQPSMTHELKRAFVLDWLNHLLEREDFPLARAVRQKAVLRSVLERKLTLMRQEAMEKSYQLALFGPSAKDRFFVDQVDAFSFEREYYPSSTYGRQMGRVRLPEAFLPPYRRLRFQRGI